MDYFVVSDIHGCLDSFNEVLEKFDPTTQQLVLLGDYLDRGDNSLGVVKRVMELKDMFPSTKVLRGNHEEMFLDFVSSKLSFADSLMYINRNGGKSTIESFTGSVLDLSNYDTIDYNLRSARFDIVLNHKDVLEFLRNNCEFYYATDNILFTHAGYNTTICDWGSTSETDFIWVRRHYMKKPTTHHINVFGHTPTHSIRKLTGGGISNSPLFIEHIKGGYLAIDGACAYGGQLNAVVLDEKGRLCKTHISS